MPFFNELTKGKETQLRVKVKNFVKLFLPPILLEFERYVVNKLGEHPWLEYAPAGWNTVLPHIENIGWNSIPAVETEKTKWQAFCANLEGTSSLAFAHEHTDLSAMCVSFHNINLTYAYVLALAAYRKETVSVLDWGGSLGHYYMMGKAVLPDVKIDFHCKEVPLLAELGKQVNPQVHWYSDESCLARTYDLVMLNGVLQYIQDWPETLRRISPAVKRYLFFGLLPLVERGSGFVALQRHYGAEMLHEQFNRRALLEVIEGTGLCLKREFVTGYRPSIKNAPEQCELRSWLFKREVQ
jgi:putative methyltransferase (TIGR04325 family)